MADRVVITGVGMVTPMGYSARQVLDGIADGVTAAFDSTGFPACPLCARVPDFDLGAVVGSSKAERLMSREAQFAVAAARLAVRDAGLQVGTHYAPEEVALFGATGMAGLPLAEAAPLIRDSAGADGAFDPRRFGAIALKRVRPVLSFKILNNMPICFVSIFEGLQGPNAVYSPWEGQGAQAIAAGVQAIERGDARCALVGGCDVRTHELAFIALAQQGALTDGTVPGEGAAFLVLEGEGLAASRGSRIHARLAGFGIRTGRTDRADPTIRSALIEDLAGDRAPLIVSGSPAGGDVAPKARLGDLFAAAAAVQVGLAAVLAGRGTALAECSGRGREQAAFLLEGL